MEEKLKQESSNIIKIVLFGPESTGKTTLAKQLAKHYKTSWVPEYAREYLQNKWDNKQKTCEPQDLLPIAKGQIKLENELTKTANRVLFCDTDLLETKVYAEAYYIGDCDLNLEKYALNNTYDLYLLTDIDIAWEADDLRDKPNERKEMFQYFYNTLKKYNKNFIILSGGKQERLKKAVSYIDKLLDLMSNFTDKDFQQFKDKGISKAKVLDQLQTFSEGIPFVNLEKAAVVNQGISRFSNAEQEDLIALFEKSRKELALLKFVPASGAASRMFKAMFNFIDAYNPSKESLSVYIERTNDTSVKRFAEEIKNFPFYDLIFQKISDKVNSEGELVYFFVKEMLEENGLNYGFYPKGLLPFHKYETATATPFKEHLKEAELYAKTGDNANLHFTISKQHDAMFKKEQAAVTSSISKTTNTRFAISYSNQKAATDTIAVAMDNTPFRNTDGSILFRPGGHGALIENLNDQDADIIFIKNIDNVVIASNLEAVSNSKKVLAGLLLEKQSKAFNYAKLLESGNLSSKELIAITTFLEKELNVRFAQDFETKTTIEKTKVLLAKINRPIRICGMVKNEGEPGGGPFWIKDAKGVVSLQIIESAQIDKDNQSQAAILINATHFNPVDLVCGIRNHKGEKYNLLNFVDTKQGFITSKTKEGKELKALELPGLWNGAMAYWNTIFVEVPLVTFNPVKTVNDLLKPSHQA